MITKVQGNIQLSSPQVQKSQFKKQQEPSFDGRLIIDGLDGYPLNCCSSFVEKVMKEVSSRVSDTISVIPSDGRVFLELKSNYNVLLPKIAKGCRRLARTPEERFVDVSYEPQKGFFKKCFEKGRRVFQRIRADIFS